MSEKVLKILQWTSQILLPAMGTLYFALAQIWNWPYGEAIVGSILAIDTFLGALIGITSTRYNKKNNN